MTSLSLSWWEYGNNKSYKQNCPNWYRCMIIDVSTIAHKAWWVLDDVGTQSLMITLDANVIFVCKVHWSRTICISIFKWQLLSDWVRFRTCMSNVELFVCPFPGCSSYQIEWDWGDVCPTLTVIFLFLIFMSWGWFCFLKTEAFQR